MFLVIVLLHFLISSLMWIKCEDRGKWEVGNVLIYIRHSYLMQGWLPYVTGYVAVVGVE